jgi:hypothetical protein
MFIDLKNYEYTSSDTIYCLDSNGNKFPKNGFAKLRRTILGELKVIFEYKLTDKQKPALTSKFITEKGFEFTSIKLKNKLLTL